MTEALEKMLASLGFKFGSNGPHAARTMMLADVGVLCSHLPIDANRADYGREAIELNRLGKPTKKARELALRHLVALYGLDPSLAIFRAFRRLWSTDEAARPVLALCLALARDPLLRSTQNFVLAKKIGAPVSRDELEQLLATAHHDRFSQKSLKSFAQNVGSTWTQSGYLSGRSPRLRTAPVVTPANVAFALFLGHLEGFSGQRLFTTQWMTLLGRSTDELVSQTRTASHRGLLVFLNAGGVQEIRFPGYLTHEEEQKRQEISHVI